MPDQDSRAVRRQLLDLAALAVKTKETERRILASAEERLEAVRADLDKLRPRVLLNPAVADQYRELVLESGQLELVIARAREVLGEG